MPADHVTAGGRGAGSLENLTCGGASPAAFAPQQESTPAAAGSSRLGPAAPSEPAGPHPCSTSPVSHARRGAAHVAGAAPAALAGICRARRGRRPAASSAGRDVGGQRAPLILAILDQPSWLIISYPGLPVRFANQTRFAGKVHWGTFGVVCGPALGHRSLATRVPEHSRPRLLATRVPRLLHVECELVLVACRAPECVQAPAPVRGHEREPRSSLRHRRVRMQTQGKRKERDESMDSDSTADQHWMTFLNTEMIAGIQGQPQQDAAHSSMALCETVWAVETLRAYSSTPVDGGASAALSAPVGSTGTAGIQGQPQQDAAHSSMTLSETILRHIETLREYSSRPVDGGASAALSAPVGSTGDAGIQGQPQQDAPHSSMALFETLRAYSSRPVDGGASAALSAPVGSTGGSSSAHGDQPEHWGTHGSAEAPASGAGRDVQDAGAANAGAAPKLIVKQLVRAVVFDELRQQLSRREASRSPEERALLEDHLKRVAILAQEGMLRAYLDAAGMPSPWPTGASMPTPGAAGARPEDMLNAATALGYAQCASAYLEPDWGWLTQQPAAQVVEAPRPPVPWVWHHPAPVG